MKDYGCKGTHIKQLIFLSVRQSRAIWKMKFPSKPFNNSVDSSDFFHGCSGKFSISFVQRILYIKKLVDMVTKRNILISLKTTKLLAGIYLIYPLSFRTRSSFKFITYSHYMKGYGCHGNHIKRLTVLSVRQSCVIGTMTFPSNLIIQ